MQGGAFPANLGLTLAHLATIGSPLNVRATLFSSTSSHGTALLHIKITPSLLFEVPLISEKETLRIFIFDGL